MAGRAGMTVSVDGASAAPLERVGAEPFLQLTNGAALLFVNGDQGRVLTGREEPEQAARVLNAWYPHVVMKLGADGALFYANGRPDPVRVPGPPLEKLVDRTGAGDAFCAGFLPAWLDKKPPRRPWSAAAAWPPARSAWSARGRCCSRVGHATWSSSSRSHGRVALVTGGSSGIGWGIAQALSGAGAAGRPGRPRRRPAGRLRRGDCARRAATPPGPAPTSATGPAWTGPPTQTAAASASPTSWSTAPGSTSGRRWTS